MQESPQSRPDSGNEDNLHWGIAYLREDIQDMRQEIRALREDMHRELNSNRESLSAKIDNNYEALLKRIDVRFYLTVSMMFGMTAAIIGAIKL